MVIALLVLLAGGLGAIARFAVDARVESSTRLGEFPWGTLVVNLGGTFLLGLLVGLGSTHRTMLLLGTATLGSYTTFSTWMLETHRPAEAGEARLAWQNIVAGMVCGLAAVALGRAVGRLI